MSALEIPSQYGFVLLAAASTGLANVYHMSLTSKWRKVAKVKYPITYADQSVADKDINAQRFNCAQRAHANYTENHVPVVVSLLIAGLKYPVVAGALGGLWTVSRIMYAAGYATGRPDARRPGATLSALTSLPLLGMALYASAMMALAAL